MVGKSRPSSLSPGPLSGLYRDLVAGTIDRRTFLARSAALGVVPAFAGMLAGRAGAQEVLASPGATPDASPVADAGTRPEFGT